MCMLSLTFKEVDGTLKRKVRKEHQNILKPKPQLPITVNKQQEIMVLNMSNIVKMEL